MIGLEWVRAAIVAKARLLAIVVSGFIIGFQTGPTFWRGILHELLAGLVDAIPLLAGGGV